MESRQMNEPQDLEQKPLYSPRAKSVYASGENYVDGDRLHSLLLERTDTIKLAMNDKGKVDWTSEHARINPELALMFEAIVDNLMKSLNYKRYTGEWRECMKHTALVYLIKYCIRYDVEKARTRRQELNSKRKKPLAPVDEGKMAFNYVSWSANTAIFSTIAKLKDKKEKYEAAGLDEGRMVSTVELDEDVINHYNLRCADDTMFEEDEDGNLIDPLVANRKAKLEARINRYAGSALKVANEYLEKNPTEQARKRVKAYLLNKWGIDLDTGKPVLDRKINPK